MANITITGNTTDRPAVNFTSTGTAAANFTVAENSRHRDEQTGEWVDGTTTFWEVEAFGGLAERIADQVGKGQRVVVVGKTRTREWTDRDGNHRRNLRVNASDIAVSLKFGPKDTNTAEVEDSES